MDVQWFSTGLQGVATIYETNITLNTVASNYLKNFYTTMIGYDPDSDTVIIKGITKEEITLGLFKDYDTHSISIKPSYGRINGKKIIENINAFHHLDFSEKKYYKFNCEWYQKEKYLKIYLNKEVI